MSILRDIRETKGLSRYKVCNDIGMHTTRLLRLEKAPEKMLLMEAGILCTYYEIAIDDLMNADKGYKKYLMLKEMQDAKIAEVQKIYPNAKLVK